MKTLTDLSPVVLFSAAVPGQGGVEHLNEQWQEYWIDKFAQRGYVAIDCLRPRIWNDTSIRWWYAQNTLLYVRETSLNQYPLLEAMRTNSLPTSLVHPRMYQGLHYYLQPQNVPVREGVRFFGKVLRHSMVRQCGKLARLIGGRRAEGNGA